jgi:uncharacterized protein (DUF779 family)
MTSIYNRAKYIVGVPDLHLEHLVPISLWNSDSYQYISAHDQLIFYLLHGQADQIGYDEK